jgi:hypothetical protein
VFSRLRGCARVPDLHPTTATSAHSPRFRCHTYIHQTNPLSLSKLLLLHTNIHFLTFFIIVVLCSPPSPLHENHFGGQPHHHEIDPADNYRHRKLPDLTMEKSPQTKRQPTRIAVTTWRIAALAAATTVLGAALMTMSIQFAMAYPGAGDTARVIWSMMLGCLLLYCGTSLAIAAWVLRGCRWNMGWTDKGEWRWVLK